MKRILLLGTGGTIACKRTDKGLKPVITPRSSQRRRAGLCQGPGRIWGHCHDSGKHSGQDKDPSHGSLFRGGRRQYGYGVPLCGGYCGHCIPVHPIDELGSVKAREPRSLRLLFTGKALGSSTWALPQSAACWDFCAPGKSPAQRCFLQGKDL